ncbi:30S ribosomal protein S18 [Candidatus Uhrbacteria bacterium]|nr:30S ribosomal protein S18 [Candidatus Uhrbacteria bacterium]
MQTKSKSSAKQKLTRAKHCAFCANQSLVIDFKNSKLLQRYISSYGKIVSRKRSGVCTFHQRKLSGSIKQARIMALLPFVAE